MLTNINYKKIMNSFHENISITMIRKLNYKRKDVDENTAITLCVELYSKNYLYEFLKFGELVKFKYFRIFEI